MGPIMEATLSKWGNSQGVRIPKEVCDLFGAGVGSKVGLHVDEERYQVTLMFDRPQQKYHRNRKLTMDELMSGWEGAKVGEEWGGIDVGAEVVD